MLTKIRRGWELPESAATPEAVFHDRRRLIKAFAAGPIVLSAPALLAACDEGQSDGSVDDHAKPGYGITEHVYDKPGDYIVRVQTQDHYGAKPRGYELCIKSITQPARTESTGNTYQRSSHCHQAGGRPRNANTTQIRHDMCRYDTYNKVLKQ